MKVDYQFSKEEETYIIGKGMNLKVQYHAELTETNDYISKMENEKYYLIALMMEPVIHAEIIFEVSSLSETETFLKERNLEYFIV